MTETLTIHREWSEGYSAYTRKFTLEELLTLQKLLDLEDMSQNGDDFTHFITGLNCDSYADLSCDIMKDMWEECPQLEGCYDRCMREDEFQTCYTVYRLWNSRLSQDDALKSWKESCICTLEGILEDN